MNTTNNKKRTYTTPEATIIKLDNEISLALESTLDFPPAGPGESYSPEFTNQDPFRNQNA